MLVNGEDLYLETEVTRHYEPDEQRTYHTFYSVEYMRSLFPEATILPPVNDEMQHCCVIRKSAFMDFVRLTDSQRNAQFAEDGFLVVRNALDADTVNNSSTNLIASRMRFCANRRSPANRSTTISICVAAC